MKIFYVFLTTAVVSAFVFTSCKAKQESTTTVTPTQKTLLEAGKTKYPGLTQEELDSGAAIYANQCARCHGAKQIEGKSEEEWTKILGRMVPKAKLDETQKRHVEQYVFSVLAKSK